MELIQTNAQKARNQAHATIIQMFKSLRKEHPTAKNLRLIATIA